MKRASTLFLKTVIIAIAIGVLLLAVFAFPSMWQGATAEWSAASIALYPVLSRIFPFVLYTGLAGIFATVIPFFFALSQGWRLLRNIDANNAFSTDSIQALQFILFCGIAMSVLYAAAMPLMYVAAELDDAPGIILIWAAIVLAPSVVSTFAAVLRKLVQSAVDMKTENDLTV